MALKFATSFETASVLSDGLQSGGAFTYVTTGPTTGAREARFAPTAGVGAYCRTSETANGGDTGLAASTTGYLHGAVVFDAWTTDTDDTVGVLTFGLDLYFGAHVDENGVLNIGYNDGTHNVHVGTGSLQLVLGTRYNIELVAVRGSGQAYTSGTIYVNGKQVSTWSGTSANDLATAANVMMIGDGRGCAGAIFRIDDVVFYDSTGASMTTRQGPMKVYTLHPASDPATSHANWTKPGGATTNLHQSVGGTPPTYQADSTSSGDALKELRNAPSSANSDLDIGVDTYTAAGITSNYTIKAVQTFAITGSGSATDTAGDLGMSNPTISQTAFTTYDNGVASSTVTTWRLNRSTVAYAPSPTLGTTPVITLRKVTATTRVVLTNRLYVLVVTSAPIFKTLTPATESDAAQAITQYKSVSATPPTETDAAQAITQYKSVALTPATETDAAQTLSYSLEAGDIQVTLTPATETDSAQALTQYKSVTVTPSAETDSAQALTQYKSVTATPATESDAAQALTAYKSATVSPAVESDAAQTLSVTSRFVTLVPATETDSAQALVVTKSATLVPATESDSAVALAVSKVLGVTSATESDSAQPLTHYRSVDLTPAVESDAAQVLTATKYVTLTPATESDQAQALVASRIVELVPANTTDSAVQLTVTKSAALTPAQELDEAQVLDLYQTYPLTPAEESDSAQLLTVYKSVTLTPATETDTAADLYVVAGPIFVTLVPATESDHAVGLTSYKTVTLAPATEQDVGVALVIAKGVNLSPALESSTGTSLSINKSATLAPAQETSTATGLVVQKTLTLVPAAELDSGVALEVSKALWVTPSVESDEAASLVFYKLVGLTPAEEIDTAVAPTVYKRVFIQPATESDTGRPLAYGFLKKTLVPALESDAALSLIWSRGFQLQVDLREESSYVTIHAHSSRTTTLETISNLVTKHEVLP